MGGNGTPTARQTRFALIAILPSVHLGLTVALALVSILLVLVPLAFTLATGAVVAGAVHAAHAGWSSPQGAHLVRAVALAGSLFVFDQLLGPIQVGVSDTLGLRLNGVLRQRVMHASFGPAGVAHLEDSSVLDNIAMARGVGPGQFTPGSAVTGLAGIATQRVRTVGQAIIIAVRFSPVLAVAILAVGIVTRRVMRDRFLATISVLAGRTDALRRAHWFRDAATTPAAAKEIRVFGLTRFLVDRMTGHWVDAMRDVWKQRGAGRWKVAMVFVVSAGATFVGYALVARAAAHGAITVGTLAVLLVAISEASNTSLGDQDMHVEYGLASFPAIDRLEAATEQVSSAFLAPVAAANSAPGRVDVAAIPRARIRFEAVRFRYPGSDRDVYDGLELEIPAGRSLAVVGVNGAGKTTLVKLLARLYDPSAGRVTVDGIDIRELDPGQWQRRVAAIFQDFVHYELPAHDNVAFGAVERLNDRVAVARAVDRAGASAVIDALPNGIDTVLSRQFLQGSELSGGQWQRIALARALFAVDAGAGVLVLDEPTANLDVRAEAELFDRFLELTRGVTTIVISHRFSTVRRADRIVVLDHGRVTEAGTHAELVAQGGRYARMFELQAARFATGVAPTEGDGHA